MAPLIPQLITHISPRLALQQRGRQRDGWLHRVACALLSLGLLCTAPAALALPDDREQPIHITADKALRDEKRGVTIYSGNVEMRQGSLELDADDLTIFHEGEDANKIVARGTPARMRQQPEIDSGIVNAHAEEITYLRRTERVKLRTGAHLERDDGTLVIGDTIDYFIVEQVVRAESDTSDEDDKVIVTIPPSVHRDKDDEPVKPEANADSQPQPAAVTVAPPADTPPEPAPAEPEEVDSGGAESE